MLFDERSAVHMVSRAGDDLVLVGIAFPKPKRYHINRLQVALISVP